MIASSRAPGISRSVAGDRWPAGGAQARALLQYLKGDARKSEHPPAFPFRGIDRDEEAVDAARRNARAVGLGKAIEVAIGDATEPLVVEGLTPGLLVTNPPYGDRLKAGGQKGMKSFYFKLGEMFAQLRGSRAFILPGNPVFESAFHARPHLVRTLWNGPIECRLMGYVFPPSH